MNNQNAPTLDDLKEIACISGDIARNHFTNTGLLHEIKEDGTPLSETDTKIHELITDSFIKNFPHVRILSEEGTTGSTDAEYTLIVDPIDGTIPYISKVPIFTVCLALLKNMEPIRSVIFDPILMRMWSAEKGAGAYLNDMRIKTCKKTDLKGAQIHMSNWFGSTQFCNLDKLAKELFDYEVGVTGICSGAYFGALVASASMDVGMSMIRYGWEAAALEVIITEAGGVITDAFGNPLTYGPNAEINGYVASANQAIHDQITYIMNRCRYQSP